jgi:hypothetical protein
MIKLTKIFKINYRINKIVEIVKTIGNYSEFTITLKDNIIVDNDGYVSIKESVFNAKKDFFTKLRSI